MKAVSNKLLGLLVASGASLLLMATEYAAIALYSSSVAAATNAEAKKSIYSWADVAKWPDLTTGAWGYGAANSNDLVARDLGLAEALRPAGGAPVVIPGLGGAGAPNGRHCMGAVFCKVTDLPITDAFRHSLDSKLHNASLWSCEPMGVIGESGTKFYFTKDVVLIGGLSDYYNVWRRVYMDGRGHPPDIEPSYFGHSIGHWEGDTLVIDTVSIRAEAKLGQGLQIGNYDTHLIERIRLTDPNTLEIKKTVINPGVFVKPVEFTISHVRIPNYEFPETYCWHDLDEGGKKPDAKLE
jgi:hypothetical protein